MKQQVEVRQRGSVDFKHRCATRNPVFIYTEPRRLATEGNPLVSHRYSDPCVTSRRQVVPFSGTQGAPLISWVKPLTLSCEIQIVGESLWDSNWRKGIPLCEGLPPAETWNSCYTGWKTPGARCVVRAGFTAGYSSSVGKFPSPCMRL